MPILEVFLRIFATILVFCGFNYIIVNTVVDRLFQEWIIYLFNNLYTVRYPLQFALTQPSFLALSNFHTSDFLFFSYFNFSIIIFNLLPLETFYLYYFSFTFFFLNSCLFGINVSFYRDFIIFYSYFWISLLLLLLWFLLWLLFLLLGVYSGKLN